MEHWWEWWRKVLIGRCASQVDRGAGCDLVPGSTCSNLTFPSALPAWILGISMFSLFFVCRLFYQSQSHLHPFSPWPPSSHLPVPPCIKDFLSWAAKKNGFHSLLVPFFTSMNECQGRKTGGSTWFPSVTEHRCWPACEEREILWSSERFLVVIQSQSHDLYQIFVTGFAPSFISLNHPIYSFPGSYILTNSRVWWPFFVACMAWLPSACLLPAAPSGFFAPEMEKTILF